MASREQQEREQPISRGELERSLEELPQDKTLVSTLMKRKNETFREWAERYVDEYLLEFGQRRY